MIEKKHDGLALLVSLRKVVCWVLWFIILETISDASDIKLAYYLEAGRSWTY